MNKFYKCSRGPKTNFDSLREHRLNWIPKLEKHTVSKNGCWEWSGALNDSGYGVVSAYHENGRTKLEYVHRLSYFLHKGEIPNDRVVDHICHNQRCLNPQHLRLKSHEDNAVSSVEKPLCGVCGFEKIRVNSGRLVCSPCSVIASTKYKRKRRVEGVAT